MKNNINYYIQAVNTAITDTEDNGELLNEHFEVLRTALDNETISEISIEQSKKNLQLVLKNTVGLIQL